MAQRTLILVYNADSGRLNLLFDIAHKILSPSTYPCELCSLSHGYFTMRAGWREFTERLGMEVAYLHRDEYPSTAPAGLDYPLILLKQGSDYSLLISREEIAACHTPEALQRLIIDRLAD